MHETDRLGAVQSNTIRRVRGYEAMEERVISSDTAGSLSIRGGGLLGGFMKFLILPIGIGILPVVLVNLWIAEEDLRRAFLFVVVILGPFLVLALIIDVVSFLQFQLKLQNDGMLYVKDQTRGEPIGFHGSIQNATSAKLEPEVGMPFCLYQGNQLIVQWSTKPMSSSSLQRFLRRLKEINSTISLNDYAMEILERGTIRKINRAMLGVLWPVLMGLGVLLYLPTLELFCVKVFLGHLNWVQRSLRDMFYLSLVPLSVTTLLAAFTWDAKFWRSDALRRSLRLAFLIPFLQLLSGLWAKRASLLTNTKLIVSVFTIVGLANLIFFVRSHVQAVKAVRGLIVFGFASVALTLHLQNCRDFFEAPVVVKNVPAIVDRVTDTRDGVQITFHLQDRNGKLWSFTVPRRRSRDEERILPSGQFVNLYYTPHLRTLLKVEDALNGEMIYRRT